MQGIESLPYEVKTQPLDVKGGIADYQQAAKMLAEFGREGDVYIVHAAEGETVVPLEVLQANPRMKNMIFKQMKDMGLEPERYIVGNQLNTCSHCFTYSCSVFVTSHATCICSRVRQFNRRVSYWTKFWRFVKRCVNHGRYCRCG